MNNKPYYGVSDQPPYRVVGIRGAWIPAVVELILSDPKRLGWNKLEEITDDIGNVELRVYSTGPSVKRLYRDIEKTMMEKEVANGHELS